MKKFFIVLSVLVVLIIGGVLAIVANLNTIIEKAVNTYGPQLTNTSVTLGKADISLLSGHIGIQNFVLSNPQGFTKNHAIKIDSAKVDFDPKSLLEDTILIKDISINAPDILYEWSHKGNNIDTIINNIKKNVQDDSSKAAQPTKSTNAASSQTTSKKVIIDCVSINSAKTELNIPLIQQALSVTLPDIKIHSIGREGQEVEIATAAIKILDTISKELLKTSGYEVKDNLQKSTKENVQNIGNALRGAIKGLFNK